MASTMDVVLESPPSTSQDGARYVERSGPVTSPRSLEDVGHQAEAYASFANISALVFGFSVSVIWNEEYDSDEKNESDKGDSVFRTVKLTLLNLTIAFSGFALVVHAIQYYVVKELISKRNVERLETWILKTRSAREMARRCMWWSLGAFMSSTIVHLLDGESKIIAGAGGTILTLGFAAMAWAVLTLRPSRIK